MIKKFGVFLLAFVSTFSIAALSGGNTGLSGQQQNIDINSVSVQGFPVWHSGNFIAGTDYQIPLIAGTDYVVPATLGNYLLDTTDTLTGDLTVTGSITTNTQIGINDGGGHTFDGSMVASGTQFSSRHSSAGSNLIFRTDNVSTSSATTALTLDSSQNASFAGAISADGEILTDTNFIYSGKLAGGYGLTGASNTWGQTIYGMGSSFSGDVSGDAYAPTNLYGLAWLRVNQGDTSPEVGEGVYQMQNGVVQSAMGQYGVLTPKLTQSGTRGFLQVKNSGNTEYSYGALMGVSSTANEYLFGGHATSDAAMDVYIRLGADKIEFNSASYTNADIFHTGNFGGVNTYDGNLELYSTTASGVYTSAAIEVQELNNGGAQTGAAAEAPAIAWHWGGRQQSEIALESDGYLQVRNGSSFVDANFRAATIDATTGVTTPNITTVSGNLNLAAASGHILLNPTTAGYYVRTYYAGVEKSRVNGTRNDNYQSISIPTTDFLFFDGGSNTYMQENTADNLRVVAGGTERLNVNSSGIQVIGSVNATNGLNITGGTATITNNLVAGNISKCRKTTNTSTMTLTGCDGSMTRSAQGVYVYTHNFGATSYSCTATPNTSGTLVHTITFNSNDVEIRAHNVNNTLLAVDTSVSIICIGDI